MRMLIAAAAAVAAGSVAAVAHGETTAASRATVFFLADGELAPALRSAPARGDPVAAALRALLRGPTPAERRRGLRSAIPPGSRLLALEVKGGVARVKLSSRFLGRTAEVPAARLAQVVYTATAFEGVRRVAFSVSGKGVRGLTIPVRPVARGSYARFLPGLLLEQPAPGERVRGPMRVRGSAAGRLTVLLLDGRGELLASRSFANRPRRHEPFDFTLRQGAHKGRARLIAFTVSGTRVEQVEIDVVVG